MNADGRRLRIIVHPADPQAVERLFAWAGRDRRFSGDVERLIACVEAFLYPASSVILLRSMARC